MENKLSLIQSLHLIGIDAFSTSTIFFSHFLFAFFYSLFIFPDAGPDLKYFFGFMRTQLSTTATIALILGPKVGVLILGPNVGDLILGIDCKS